MRAKQGPGGWESEQTAKATQQYLFQQSPPLPLSSPSGSHPPHSLMCGWVTSRRRTGFDSDASDRHVSSVSSCFWKERSMISGFYSNLLCVWLLVGKRSRILLCRYYLWTGTISGVERKKQCSSRLVSVFLFFSFFSFFIFIYSKYFLAFNVRHNYPGALLVQIHHSFPIFFSLISFSFVNRFVCNFCNQTHWDCNLKASTIVVWGTDFDGIQ